MSTNRQHVATYLSDQQHRQWKERADELDMTLSEYIQAMTEAGWKKFDATVERDESADQLREQRNDLKDELDRARTRIQELETKLHHGEQAAIREFVAENPGATFEEITQHVIDTVPQRVNRHIEELEGDTLRVSDGHYYAVDDNQGEVE